MDKIIKYDQKIKRNILYKRIIINIISPVILGITIYALWRGINFIGLNPLLKYSPPDWIKFNLPDGLWLYALMSSLVLIWEDSSSKHPIVWLLIVLIFSILSEVFQLLGVIPGTFDIYDLVSYFIAAIISVFQFLKNIKLSLLTLKS